MKSVMLGKEEIRVLLIIVSTEQEKTELLLDEPWPTHPGTEVIIKSRALFQYERLLSGVYAKLREVF